MKTSLFKASLALACMTLVFASDLSAQSTAFTYQGRLNDAGTAANGNYDFRFRLATDLLATNYASTPFATNGLAVSNGLFVVTMDFGPGIFGGSNYWLEVAVKTNGASSYIVLTPLQPVTPTPYAMFANAASNLTGTLPSSQISGTIASANVSGTYGNAVTLNNPANNFSGAFAGNGANVTNVNAATLNGLNATNFWQLGGNNVSAGQFIGSTNNQPLEIWVNNSRAVRLEPNTNGAPNVIAGMAYNFVSNSVVGATVSGGGATNYKAFGALTNSVTADFGTVGGGANNVISGTYGTIGGGYYNSATAYGATIAGGESSTASGYDSTVGGGMLNHAVGGFSVVGGGGRNVANGVGATIGGGGFGFNGTAASNLADGQSSTVAGGGGNAAEGDLSAIGGGFYNSATNTYATVPGGVNNIAGGQYSFAAGNQAQALHNGAFVWADSQFATFSSTTTNQFNVRANGGARFVTGGAGMTLDSQPVLTTSSGTLGISLQQNSSGAPNVVEGAAVNYIGAGVIGATIGGGGATNYTGSVYSNSVTGSFGTVSGGAGNVAAGQASVGGGNFNTATGGSSVVGGGIYNVASGAYAVIAGGIDNVSSGYGSFVGGGGSDGTGAPGNHATGNASTIGGGYGNCATNRFSTVSGGLGNDAYGNGAFIGGGGYDGNNFSGNLASGGASTIAGGLGNQATNNCAVIPGGATNLAGGLYSFAAGQQAQALHQGSFVWADSQNTAFASTNNNSFNVRAGGGVRLVTSGAGLSLDGPFNLPTNVNFTSSGYTALHIDNVNFEGDTFLGVAAGYVSGLGLANTAVGNTAMGGNTSGSENTAVGAYSLYRNSAGNNNTAIGGMALYSAMGSGNIAVGYQAGINLNGTEANDIYIGNAGVATESSTIRIGTPGTQSTTYLAGAINGNGSGLTNLNASQLTSGTVPDTRLSGTYSSALTLNNAGNSYSGSGANLTSLNANNLASGTVPLARLPTAVVTNNDSNVSLNGTFTLANGGTSLAITPGYLFGTASNNCVTLDVPGFAQKIAIWDNLYISDNVYASGNVYANGVQLTSDRNAKENFTALDPKTVLEKVASLPMSEWNYKRDGADRHVGPMAQDFHAAFGLNGDDDKHISMVDEGGVALAAIQGLNQKLEEQKAENADLKRQLAELKAVVQQLAHAQR